MKKEGLFILFLCTILLLASAVSAEMSISSPKSVYNVGNSFLFNVTIISASSTNNFLTAKIVCAENNEIKERDIYRNYQSIIADKPKNIDISGRFDNFLIGELKGNCYLSVNFGADSIDSKNFYITRGISINAGSDKTFLNPGERFIISGKATKENGNLVDKGFIELKLNELNITSFRTIEKGEFSFAFDLAENTPAGDYLIYIRVYERDNNGETTNEGETNVRIKINQIIKKNSIAVSLQSLAPGEELIYTPLIYDQSGKEINENVQVSIYNPNGDLFSEQLLKAGEMNNFSIGFNYMPGNWKIKSKINNFLTEKTFYVEKFEDITYKLINGTLVVTNTGNVPYEKTIEIKIGSGSVLQEISLKVGETKRYALSAIDGEYPVEINDGENKELVGNSFLTGGAIGVRAEGSSSFWSKSYLVLWILLIGIGILVVLNQYSKISNKTYIGKTPTEIITTEKFEPKKTTSFSTRPSKENIISEGAREDCSVIALKLKNADEIGNAKESAMDTIERALTRAKDARAKVYSDKNYRTIIFAPSLTREKDNSLKAVSIAKEIEAMLLEHNKRFGEKIAFGIGIHNGEMISENASGDFKFSAVGNVMPYAKNVADSVNSEVGISEAIHRKILGKVKSDKIEGTNYWRVSRIRDAGAGIHSEFINKFVQRQKTGKDFFSK